MCCRAGFTAASGWDPVTGLGAVSYSQLYRMLNGSLSTEIPEVISSQKDSPMLYFTSQSQAPAASNTQSVVAVIIILGLTVAIVIFGMIIFTRICCRYYCYKVHQIPSTKQPF